MGEGGGKEEYERKRRERVKGEERERRVLGSSSRVQFSYFVKTLLYMNRNQSHDAPSMHSSIQPNPPLPPEARSTSLSSQTPRAGSNVRIHLYTKTNQHKNPLHHHHQKIPRQRKKGSKQAAAAKNSHPSIFSHALAASVRS